MSGEQRSPSRWLVAAAFAAVYVIWGSTYLAIRYAIETLPPFLMAGSRHLVAGAFLFAWIHRRGAPPGSPVRAPRDWAAAALVGGLMLLGGNGGVCWAEQRVPSGVTSLLVATVPIWMAVLPWLRHARARPAGRAIGGLVAGFAGVLLMAGPGELAGNRHVDRLGTGVLLVASLSWSLGSLCARRHAHRTESPEAGPSGALAATSMQMLAGGALLLILGTASGEAARLSLSAVSLRSVLALLYLVFFGSLVGFTAYVWLLRVVAPVRVATYAYVNPVIAVMLGWLVGGEELTLRTILAAAVIVPAVAVISRTAKSRS